MRAGWPAFVVSILVQPGDQVVEGDPVAVLESMKMESTITAPYPGEVLAVDVVPISPQTAHSRARSLPRAARPRGGTLGVLVDSAIMMRTPCLSRGVDGRAGSR